MSESASGLMSGLMGRSMRSRWRWPIIGPKSSVGMGRDAIIFCFRKSRRVSYIGAINIKNTFMGGSTSKSTTRETIIRGDSGHVARWWEARKEDLVAKLSTTKKVATEKAMQIANAAIPVLAAKSKAAALEAVRTQFGEAAAKDVASMLDEIEANLHKMGAVREPEVMPTGLPKGAYVGRGEFYNGVSDYAWHGAVEECSEEVTGGGDTIDGGCGCGKPGYIGSEELDITTVQNYSNSVNSKAKNKVIAEILDAAGKMRFNVTGATQQEQIRSLLKALPDNMSIKNKDQAEACASIARAINAAHGNQIINPSMPPEVICQQVAEIISSLAAGMHTEFLAVYSDVRKVLRNLHILKNALKDDHNSIVLKMKGSDDALLAQEITTLNDLHSILTDEIDRQIHLLSNLLNVTLFPADKDLAALIRSKKDIHGYIEKIDVKVGSERFGKVVSDILKGLGLTANFALLIDKALKTVGLTMDEYAKGGSVSKLREKITAGLMGKNMNESQLHEYLEAAELLVQNFYRNQDIANKLETTKTGQYEGGDDEYRKSVMDKRIADRTKLRNLIFKAFHKQINDMFDQLVGAIDTATAKVGTEIPLSDQLNSFRHILQKVNEDLVRNKHIYHALIGYYNDALSKSKKDEFMGDLKMISSYVETLVEMPLYAQSKGYFTNIQGYIDAIIKVIDRFSDEIAAKFGRGEGDECQYMDEGEGKGTGAKEGGFESDGVYGGAIEDEPRVVFKTTKSINDAIRVFDYKYRVAQIKANLAATGKELDSYSEKYEKIIANSIADILIDEQKVYEALRKQLTDDTNFGALSTYALGDVKGLSTEPEVAKEREAARKFLDAQWDVKKKFWATVEAVDSYMRVFTDSLVKNPQDIKEIKSMLDSIEVIDKWYTDETGDNLVSVFEQFPSYMNVANGGQGILTGPDATAYSSREVVYPPKAYSEANGTHYYQRIHNRLQESRAAQPAAGIPAAGAVRDDSINISAYPGNPYLVTLPSLGEAAKAAAKKTLGGLAVLKNLLSVFIHVGNKFGGEEIHKKVFMTPTQMYNNLIDYLQTSAFAQGFGLGGLKIEPSGSLSQSFYDTNNVSIEINVVTTAPILGSTAPTARNPWAPPTTYGAVNSSVVHLGVTSNATWGVVDYQNGPDLNRIRGDLIRNVNTLGDNIMAQVDQVNASIITRINDLRAVARPVMPPDRQNQFNPLQTLAFPQDALPRPFIAPPVGVTNAAKIILFKKRWGVWMRSVIGRLGALEGFSFKREDEYFKLILKSLAAKILTVTGMYDVMDRPAEFNGLSPIRMITGGAMDTPKVDEGAVALYLRLPLLAQFYRGIFGFTEGTEDANNQFETVNEWRGNSATDKRIKISMVPDVDGTFAGLIRLIFRKNKFTAGSNYSDEDMKDLIREVNLVYQRMQTKYPQNTTMETIHEFVAEINRRYGVVSQQERDKWEREFGYRYDYSKLSGARTDLPRDTYEEPPDTDYAILPGETEEEVQRPSAAQKLLGASFESSAEKKRLFTINKAHKDLVYKFRCAIDKYFEQPDEEFTFNHAIKSAQLKLKKEQNDESRFRIVAALVRGVDIYTKTDGMKYVLFHETVVSGLNVLSSIHSMLARFKKRAHVIDLMSIEREIWTYLSGIQAGTRDMDGLVAHINRYLTNDLGLAETGDQELSKLVAKMLGYHESRYWNGGHTRAIHGAYSIKGGNGFIPITGADAVIDLNRLPAAGGAFGVDANGRISSNHAGNVPRDPANPAIGLVGVLCGFTAKDLRTAYEASKVPPAGRPAKLAAETFMRFIFGREHVMKELLESLFGLSNDFQGLVDVRIEDSKLFISFGGLKTLIEDMFQHVHYFLDLLRPHINPKIVDKYTNKFTPGSFYWLQEQLVEKILVGRPGATQALEGETGRRTGYASIDELLQRLSYTYDRLTRTWAVDGANLSADRLSTTNEVQGGSRNNFDKVFAEMIFYDSSRPGSGLLKSLDARDFDATSYEATGGVTIADYLRDPYDALHFNGPTWLRMLDTRFIARFNQLYSWKDNAAALSNNRSALFMFNQLVAKYIQTFYDPVSSKIYSGAIDKFANGVFSRAIADFRYTYPDTLPLVFVKYNSATGAKLPNTTTLSPLISNEILGNVSALKDLILQYMTIGIRPGDHSDPARRSRLLNPTNQELLIRDGYLDSAGVDITAPRMYTYLALHLIGIVLNDLFNVTLANVPFATVAGAAGSPFTLVRRQLLTVAAAIGGTADLPAAAALIGGNTFGDICAYYALVPNKRPTIVNIMDRLLSNDNNAHLTRIDLLFTSTNAADAVANNRFTIPLAGQPLANVLGISTDTGNAFPSRRYVNAFNSILVTPSIYEPPGNVPTQFAGLLIQALKSFPFQDIILGKSAEENAYHADLFAHIMGALASSYKTHRDNAALADNVAQDNAFAKSVTDINGIVLSTPSTYTIPSSLQPKHSVKQEDLLAVDTGHIGSVGIGSPLADNTYLVVARRETITGLGPNTIDGLGVTPPPNRPPMDDSLASMSNFGRRADPDGEHVLFASLAAVIRNIVTSRNDKAGELIHVHTNVADIALYMKEKMRANLPFFRSLFKELSKRCEFIKLFANHKEMSLARVFTDVVASGFTAAGAAIRAGIPSYNPWPYQLKTPTAVDAETKDRFTGILDSIIQGCNILATSCEQTLREVGDDPKYFELYQNSIKDYKAQNSVDPLMPLSSTLTFLKNVNNSNYTDFLPIHSLGKDQFKLHYGTRSILGQPTTQPMAEHVQGFSQIVDSYNLIIDTKMQVDKARSDGFMSTFIKLLRYVYELKHVKGIMTPYIFVPTVTVNAETHPNQYDLDNANSTRLHIGGMFTRDDLVLVNTSYGNPATQRQLGAPHSYDFRNSLGVVVLTNRADLSLAGDEMHTTRVDRVPKIQEYARPVYAIMASLANTIRLTESTFKDDRIKELVEHLSKSGAGKNTLEVQNIIDLNIVPINIHALRREIPLINLYNYSYTFDRLIIELYYGLQNENARKLISELCDFEYVTNKTTSISSAKDMLVMLLIDPYRDLFIGEDAPMGTFAPARLYDRYVKPMLAGVVSNGELGRPKFLSDQIFNKAVFGELYSDHGSYNEIGPAASMALDSNIISKIGAVIIGNLTVVVLNAFNSANTRYGGLLLAPQAAVDSGDLTNFCVAIADHVAANPTIKLDKLYTEVYNKFLKAGAIAEFVALHMGTDPHARLLALIASMLTILIHKIIAHTINRLHNPSNDVLAYAQLATRAILGSLLIFRGLALPGAWMGLGGGALVGEDAARRALLETIQVGAGAAGALAQGAIAIPAVLGLPGQFNVGQAPAVQHDNVNYLTEEYRNIITLTMPLLVYNIPLPIAIAAASPITVPRYAALYAIISNALYMIRPPGAVLDRPERTRPQTDPHASIDAYGSLHWLASGTTAIDDTGVEARGAIKQPDNDNVLDGKQVKAVDVSAIKNVLAAVGRLRFDTVFIRNLVFIVNLYRSIRMKLQRDLVYSKDIILRAEPITRPQITEFFGNQIATGQGVALGVPQYMSSIRRQHADY